MRRFNWCIIGSGWIAHEMGDVLQQLDGIYGVFNHSKEEAKKYAEEYNVSHVFTKEEEMLADENIDIVYVATPHNLHYQFTKNALLAGKNVFAEKVITVNSEQLEECVAIAKEKNLMIMEGMTLYHMPLFKEMKRRIETGDIGKVKLVQVNFGSHKEYDTTHRFFSKELAGGALLDIGVYALSFARFFLEQKPNVVLSTVNYFETSVDEESGILMKNEQGQMVVTALTMRAKQPKRGVVVGEKGYIEIEEYPRADKGKIVYTETGKVEEISSGNSADALKYEALALQKCIEDNDNGEELRYTRDVNALLTEVRNIWGFKYPFEE
ncbi:Gfo/Idh/MocA family oxidoreductase [Tetragenococcus koreensis]|uniref:Gfo/Idh/MocA family protein n=1 Tax=Tetragenococcus koreensis TaxID=290335 RepID=UPI000F51572B|nr:Gfo/Idh/MocA family oxidoreductase [Tetragenococcus koreensis]MDN6630625.1 Gfo/Idh/MocA family oxidoreductase [Staphylococcus equorum]MDN6730988.1 Gfo/Idh/MocA family oxidoreductase [Atopostipes suicloacalis]AYW46511.1 oxidoreductase [Tetragenococcus koreensis]MCF1585339.1 Gfo/Idh/MocA family oxidoreductase [Tetragenococcus koreensis]MCF1619757.1 Gfo/Idh/MocA family oxidoreductase [Tetragenococcus koreensis]